MKWWAANDSGLGWRSLDLRKKTPYTEKNMIHFLFDKLPKEVVGFKINNVVVTRRDVAKVVATLFVGAVYIFTPTFVRAFSEKRGFSDLAWGRFVKIV